jgi:hypothetical protein
MRRALTRSRSSTWKSQGRSREILAGQNWGVRENVEELEGVSWFLSAIDDSVKSGQHLPENW